MIEIKLLPSPLIRVSKDLVIYLLQLERKRHPYKWRFPLQMKMFLTALNWTCCALPVSAVSQQLSSLRQWVCQRHISGWQILLPYATNMKSTHQFNEYGCHWEKKEAIGTARTIKENPTVSVMFCLFLERDLKWILQNVIIFSILLVHFMVIMLLYKHYFWKKIIVRYENYCLNFT